MLIIMDELIHAGVETLYKKRVVDNLPSALKIQRANWNVKKCFWLNIEIEKCFGSIFCLYQII